MMLQEELAVGGDYAVHRYALTDTPEVIAGHALETASTVERLVGAEALARQLHSLVARVGSVPPFGPAIRVHVLASGLPFGANNAHVGVRVSAKTFTVRHCLCPNCGNDHTEGDPFDDELQPHYEEDSITFTVHEASLISRWDDYAVPGFGNFLERVGWDEVPA
jgi:hypothetical protein